MPKLESQALQPNQTLIIILNTTTYLMKSKTLLKLQKPTTIKNKKIKEYKEIIKSISQNVFLKKKEK